MSDWKYLRMTIDIAVEVGESPSRKTFVRRLLNEEARASDLTDAISEGWVEIDNYDKVEDHSS